MATTLRFVQRADIVDAVTPSLGSWRLFDVAPVWLQFGDRKVSVPHLTDREVGIIGRTMMRMMERRMLARAGK